MITMKKGSRRGAGEAELHECATMRARIAVNAADFAAKDNSELTTRDAADEAGMRVTADGNLVAVFSDSVLQVWCTSESTGSPSCNSYSSEEPQMLFCGDVTDFDPTQTSAENAASTAEPQLSCGRPAFKLCTVALSEEAHVVACYFVPMARLNGVWVVICNALNGTVVSCRRVDIPCQSTTLLSQSALVSMLWMNVQHSADLKSLLGKQFCEQMHSPAVLVLNHVDASSDFVIMYSTDFGRSLRHPLAKLGAVDELVCEKSAKIEVFEKGALHVVAAGTFEIAYDRASFLVTGAHLQRKVSKLWILGRSVRKPAAYHLHLFIPSH